jgi:chaperonin GroES
MSTLTISDIKPLAGYVVVEPVESQTQTDSGIFLPESNEEKPQMGKVVAVSDSYINEKGTEIKCPVKVGQKVLHSKWGGNEVKIGNQEVKIMKYDDLMAIVGK